MVEILIQNPSNVPSAVQKLSDSSGSEEIKRDLWDVVSEVLNWGFHWGKGADHIQITIGTLMLVTTAFLLTSYVLGLVRRLYTRSLNETDTLKFISVFKFIKYPSFY